MAAKILTALLISLSAMLVSGAPSRNTECEMLHQIKDSADSLKNSTVSFALIFLSCVYLWHFGRRGCITLNSK